jgi:arginine decarboxylase
MSVGFAVLPVPVPVPVLSPVEAYERLVNNRVEALPLARMAGRTVAAGVRALWPMAPCASTSG